VLAVSQQICTARRHRAKLPTVGRKVPAFRSVPLFRVSFIFRGADKSLARPTSRRILFDGKNISFDTSLVIYINSTNIPPIMIINRIYETQYLLKL
jgi:hypothetical protein